MAKRSGTRPRALHTARYDPLTGQSTGRIRENAIPGSIISPVGDQSPRCTWMVMVTKPTGDIRICIDLNMH